MAIRNVFLCLFLLGLITVVGCAGGDKPVKVEGVVTLDGKPLNGAAVQFYPDEGKGQNASGITGTDGSFRLTTYSTGDGALPGLYRVTIQPPSDKKADAAPIDTSNPQAMMAAMQKADAERKKNAGQAPKKVNFPENYMDAKKTPLKQKVPADGQLKLELKGTGS